MVSSVLAGSLASILRLVRRISPPVDLQGVSVLTIGSHVDVTGRTVCRKADSSFKTEEVPEPTTGVRDS